RRARGSRCRGLRNAGRRPWCSPTRGLPRRGGPRRGEPHLLRTWSRHQRDGLFGALTPSPAEPRPVFVRTWPTDAGPSDAVHPRHPAAPPDRPNLSGVSLLTLVLALVACFLFSLSAFVQQGASGSAPGRSGGVAGMERLMWSLLGNPVWVVGAAVNF